VIPLIAMGAYLKVLQGVIDPFNRFLNNLGVLFVLKYLFPCGPGLKRMELTGFSDKNTTRSELSYKLNIPSWRTYPTNPLILS